LLGVRESEKTFLKRAFSWKKNLLTNGGKKENITRGANEVTDPSERVKEAPGISDKRRGRRRPRSYQQLLGGDECRTGKGENSWGSIGRTVSLWRRIK